VLADDRGGRLYVGTCSAAAYSQNHGQLPQWAWLECSALIVEYKQEVRRCDLLSASWIRLRHALTIGRGWSFLVLEAYQKPDDEPVRLVLEGPDWVRLTAEHLRMLAQIISSRSAKLDRKTQKIVRRLHRLADYQELRPSGPVDWSFRTDPQGLKRKNSGPRDMHGSA
jgi:hypothetical protein